MSDIMPSTRSFKYPLDLAGPSWCALFLIPTNVFAVSFNTISVRRTALGVCINPTTSPSKTCARNAQQGRPATLFTSSKVTNSSATLYLSNKSLQRQDQVVQTSSRPAINQKPIGEEASDISSYFRRTDFRVHNLVPALNKLMLSLKWSKCVYE